MRILLISSVAIVTPPQKYGGLERVVYEYAKGLLDLGHEVSLVASRESEAPKGVTLIDTVKPWNELTPAEQQMYNKKDGVQREFMGQSWLAHTWNGWRAHEQASFERYKDTIESFDVIGDHSWSKWSLTSKKEEIIGTCHSAKPYNVRPSRKYPLLTGVSVGHARYMSREIHIPIRALDNPTDIELYHFQKDKGEYVLSLNRIMPQKGIHLFMEMVDKEKQRAWVAGDDSTLVPDQNYVQFIKDKCKNSAYARYYGLVDELTRLKLLREAKCLVCLKDMGYEEVFGLAAVEALASGTPVVALDSWGFRDVIQHGKNGFLCDNMDEVAKAIVKVGEISQDYCRESAVKFSTPVRSKVYEGMLTKVKEGCRW